MPLWKQALLARLNQRYFDQADDGTGQGKGGGGGGGSGDGEDEAAKAAAAAAALAAASKSGPTDAEATLLRENMKKKEENTALKAQIAALSGLKTQLDELGGLDALKSLVTERKTAEQQQLEKKGDWDRLKASMAEENAKVVKAKDEALVAKDQALQAALSQINELTLGASFTSSKFITDELTLTASKARVVYGDHFELQDGKVVGFDKPKFSGERTPLVDGYGKPLSFEDALKKIVENDPEKEHLLKVKAKSGAGSETRRTEKDTGKKVQEGATGLEQIAAGLSSLKIIPQ